MKHLIIFLIRCYQVIPFASHKMCRFTPTCSEYMIEAINEYGVIKGINLGVKRIGRCRPKGSYGYDPVKKNEGEIKVKKIISLIFIVLITISTSGCFKKDDLEGANIYTTVYPITYITEILYGKNSTINSIYPSSTNINNYKLTKKQIDEYSKSDIFIYNGLSNEKQIAKNFLNKNKKIRILDVAYGLKYNYSQEELWLSPNNFLMLAATVRKNLTGFIDNKYLVEEINKNYENLEEQISIMDAELRLIASSAANEKDNTLIVSSNLFKFLNNYGFNVISLEDEENLTQNNLATIKSNFKNKKYTTIFMKDTDEKTELINNLVESYDVKIIIVNTMNTLTEENIKNNDNYITIMNEFLENIRNVTLG